MLITNSLRYMKTKLNISLLLLTILLGFCACQKEQEKKPSQVKVTGISLSINTVSLTEGETAKITATVSPSDATNKNVTWTTDNSSVASVNNGVVTALSAGQATITAITEDGGKTATCSVTVKAKIISVVSVSLDKSSIDMLPGATVTIAATVLPSDATDNSVIWSTSDESIAKVVDGTVTAVSIGKATITVTTVNQGKTASCAVTVVDASDCYPGTTLKGIKIGNLTWAPVNCGYDAKEHPYGKLYQWGRAAGCGYNEFGSPEEPEIQTPLAAAFTDGLNSKLNDEDFNDYFYTVGGDWYADASDKKLKAWPMSPSDAGYLESKVANPCPEGWRVPTLSELDKLIGGYGTGTGEFKGATVVDKDGQLGHYFNGTSTPNQLKQGSTTEYQGVFFPAAGFRHGKDGGYLFRDGFAYYWASTRTSNGSVMALYFSRSSGFFDWPDRAFGCAVRCVKK